MGHRRRRPAHHIRRHRHRALITRPGVTEHSGAPGHICTVATWTTNEPAAKSPTRGPVTAGSVPQPWAAFSQTRLATVVVPQYPPHPPPIPQPLQTGSSRPNCRGYQEQRGQGGKTEDGTRARSIRAREYRHVNRSRRDRASSEPRRCDSHIRPAESEQDARDDPESCCSEVEPGRHHDRPPPSLDPCARPMVRGSSTSRRAQRHAETYASRICRKAVHPNNLDQGLEPTRVVGRGVADRICVELVVDAQGMARGRRKLEPGTVVHSGRESQYTSWPFGGRLRQAGLLGSMGSVASSVDNLRVLVTPARGWSRRQQARSSRAACSRAAVSGRKITHAVERTSSLDRMSSRHRHRMSHPCLRWQMCAG